jgi:methyltransferase-like protein
MLLNQQVEFLRKRADWYLFHEHLEEVNDPIYFHQFAERAASKRLQYLGEADVFAMVASTAAPQVEQVLRRLSSDLIHLQQYLDFLRNTQFRQSLLCHEGIKLEHLRRPMRLYSLHVACSVKCASDTSEVYNSEVEEFRGKQGSLKTNNPLVKAALRCLAEVWPLWLPFERLCYEARARLGPGQVQDEATITQDKQLLGTTLINGYTNSRLVELHACSPRFVTSVSEQPLASPVARLQVDKATWVTNLRHQPLELSGLHRNLLRYVDGRHTHAELLDEMTALFNRGELVAQHEGRSITDVPTFRAEFKTVIEASLQALAKDALLIG